MSRPRSTTSSASCMSRAARSTSPIRPRAQRGRSVAEATLRHDLDLGMRRSCSPSPRSGLTRISSGSSRRSQVARQPVLVVPGYSTFYEETLRPAARAASESASPAGSPTTSSTASTEPRRASSSPPSPRASACRSWTLSSGHAGRLLERDLTAGGRRRRRPVLRSDRHGAIARSSGCSTDAALRDRLREAGPEQGREVQLAANGRRERSPATAELRRRARARSTRRSRLRPAPT